MKKLFLSFLLLSLPLLASAYDVQIDGIYYKLYKYYNYNQAVVTYRDNNYNSYSGSVTIPEKITYKGIEYTKIFIGDHAFDNCTDLISVTIPNSVTSIGEYAFSGCSGLTSISIPDSVTMIQDCAFNNCSGLTSIYIPQSVNYIGDNAFSGCTGLTSVHIKDIAAWCRITFGVWFGFESYNNSNPLYYAHHLYLNGEEIRDLVIPDSVSSIGYRAFYGCSGLTSVTIPNSVTSIGSFAFSGCSGLTSVTIPNSVTSIEYEAFRGCSGLTSVTIPNSVTNIGGYAFSGCNGLTSVNIGNSVTRIGNFAFSGCIGLNSVHINDLEAWCKIEFDYYESNPLTYAHHLFLYGEEIKDLVIPNSVTSIRNSAFRGCSGLTSVTIPNSVTSIGESAFSGCSGLTSLTIPNSVTSIGNGAFVYCSGLTSIVVESGNSKYDSRNECNAIIETETNILILGCQKTKIPNTIIAIGDKAFCGCEDLESITIPNSVKSIGDEAFCHCTWLTYVTIPNSVTSIGRDAFYNCCSILSISIPNSVTSIGSGAFSDCGNLTSLSLPNSLTSIESSTFKFCNMTSLAIPNSVKTIGGMSFCGNMRITSITIPNSVTTIENWAFTNNYLLEEVYCFAEKIPTTSSNAFENSNLQNVTLYVPETAIDDYKTKAPWNEFGEIKALDENNNIFGNYSASMKSFYDDLGPWDEHIIKIEPDANEMNKVWIGNLDPRFCEYGYVAPKYNYFYGYINDEKTEIRIPSGQNIGYQDACILGLEYNNFNSMYLVNGDIVMRIKEGGNKFVIDLPFGIVPWSGNLWFNLIRGPITFTKINSSGDSEETPSSVNNLAESIPVLISANGGVITVRSEQGQAVAVYTADGKALGSANVKDGQATISTNLQRGEIVIVKVGGRSVKVKM